MNGGEGSKKEAITIGWDMCDRPFVEQDAINMAKILDSFKRDQNHTIQCLYDFKYSCKARYPKSYKLVMFPFGHRGKRESRELKITHIFVSDLVDMTFYRKL
jgi:hypothetical protein